MRKILMLFAFAGLAATQTYEIYGIRYATIKDFSVAGLVAGADKDRKMDIAMYVWLIKGGGKNILFDAGFYREKFMRRWHPSDYQKPSDALANAGLISLTAFSTQASLVVIGSMTTAGSRSPLTRPWPLSSRRRWWKPAP